MISATVITRNEERNIERCLNSLLGVADEIIVVDSESTDATVEIAIRYGAKVHSRPFSGFGSQRQYAATLASSNYVLSIDADEVLSEELRQNLIKIKEQGLKHRMYYFKVQNYVCGKPIRHCGLEPDRQIRLFDRRYATWDLLDVGEGLSYPSGVLPAPVEGSIYHYRSASMKEFEEKEMRHAALRARLMAAAGISASGPISLLRAASTYLKCHMSDGAFLDGSIGRQIAAIRFKSTLVSYRAARKIIENRK